MRLHRVPGPLHIGVPSRLLIVKDHVEPPPRRSRNHRLPMRLRESLAAIESFVAIAAVTGNDQNLARHPMPAYRDPLPECKCMPPATQIDAVIIGAGAAGLMCAIEAGR